MPYQVSEKFFSTTEQTYDKDTIVPSRIRAALKVIGLPFALEARPEGALARAGITKVTGANLGFSLEPTALMYAVGT
jgi:hypothetical protein